MSLIIHSININGFRSRKKQQYIKDYILQNKPAILCIQETHIDIYSKAKDVENFISKDYKYIWSFSNGNKSCGVCTIITDKNIICHSFQTDYDGRFIYADVEFVNTNFRVCNIYAPNAPGDRNNYFSSIKKYLVSSYHLVVIGDFNFVLNPKLDKSGGDTDRLPIGCAVFKHIIDKYKLKDVFRHLYPKQTTTTWSRISIKKELISCRLDRIYVSNLLIGNCIESSIKPCIYSDHDFVNVIINLNNSNETISIGNSYWKLNNSILNDDEFISAFEFYFKIISRTEDITLDWWDGIKNKIKEFCIDYSKSKKSNAYKEIKLLIKTYHNSQDIEEKINIKNQLENLQNKIYDGSYIRSKINMLNSNENASNYFHDKEFQNGINKTITHIIDDGMDKKSSHDILKTFHSFYENLYTDEPVDPSLNSKFLNNLPKISNDDNAMLSQPLTLDEIFSTLKEMDHTKSPGSDGLTSLIYVKFFHLFGDILLYLFNTCFESGHMSESQKLSYITLLCKDNSNKTSVKNYRPISLLNIDRKILSKVLATRLGKVLPSIIGITQTCSIPGRTIFDNIHLLRNIISYVEQKNLTACFICLDQEKAFDRVSWPFLFSTLQSFGFNDSFIHWIKVLYQDIRSSVIVNGHISEPFALTRSVRQGCSLSPLLYVLCLEPFAKVIQDDPHINGIKTPGGKFHVKMSLYADDNTTCLSDEKSISLFFKHVSDFEKVSGSRVNYKKSCGMFLGKWKSRSDHPFGISWGKNCKLLGYRFGYDLTDDDLFHDLLSNFERILNLWKSRGKSYKGKSSILNTFVFSKLIYFIQAQIVPSHYINMFQKRCFNFIWGRKLEPISRKTLYSHMLKGGLNVPNLELKIHSFYLCHIFKIINNYNTPWVEFAVYWTGLQLKKYNPSIASNNIPHSEIIPPFYVKCLSVFTDFVENCKSNVNSLWTVKEIYNYFIENMNIEPKCVRDCKSVDFNNSFKNVFSSAVDPECRNTCFSIVHNALLTNQYLFSRNMIRSSKCTFCSKPETIDHLFVECYISTSINKVVLFLMHVLTADNHKLSLKQFHYLNVDNSYDKEINYVFLILLSESRQIIWRTRNDVKFDKKLFSPFDLICKLIYRLKYRILLDFERFPSEKFELIWGNYCDVNANKKVEFRLDLNPAIYANI